MLRQKFHGIWERDLAPAALNKAAEGGMAVTKPALEVCSRPRVEKKVSALGEIIGVTKLWDNKKRGMMENSRNYIVKPGLVRNSKYYFVQNERSG